MPGKKKARENERENLFQVRTKKCVQKEFDRADIVRDVRFAAFPGVVRKVGENLIFAASPIEVRV